MLDGAFVFNKISNPKTGKRFFSPSHFHIILLSKCAFDIMYMNDDI